MDVREMNEVNGVDLTDLKIYISDERVVFIF